MRGIKKRQNIIILFLGLCTLMVILLGNLKFSNFKESDSPKGDGIAREATGANDTNKNEKEDIRRPLLVLTFDDGFETDYTIAYPLLKQRDIVGTSFINGDHIETGKRDRRMTWDQIKELKSNGWDIQGHTFSHENLPELTEEEIRQEFELNADTFELNGLSKPDHTAYPYGAHDDTVREIGKEYRKTLRRVNSPENINIPYNTWDNIDFHNLSARQTDIHDGNTDRLEYRKNDIDQSVKNNGILIFFSHEFKQSDAEQHETQVEYYEELIDYAIEKGMEFVTMSEMYDLVKEYHAQK